MCVLVASHEHIKTQKQSQCLLGLVLGMPPEGQKARLIASQLEETGTPKTCDTSKRDGRYAPIRINAEDDAIQIHG